MPTVGDAITRVPLAQRERVLDPIARTSEVLFGLIMALTFTGTLSAATADRAEIRTLLVGMIGCNLAWGLVDAVMFLMSAMTTRANDRLTLGAVRRATRAEDAYRAIAGAVPPMLSAVLTPSDFEKIRQGLLRSRDVPNGTPPTRDDWLGALAVFILVVLSTFPIVVPFLLVRNVHVALRLSNLIALAMMFGAGYSLARHGGYHPVRTGLIVVVLGMLLVGIAIALGG